MKEIFAALSKLRLNLNGLRPTLTWGRSDEAENNRLLLERLQEFKKQYNITLDTAESRYPFVPDAIYAPIKECNRLAHAEIAHIETAGDRTFSHEWFNEGEDTRDKFDEAYYTAVKSSRAHFKSLTIISKQ